METNYAGTLETAFGLSDSTLLIVGLIAAFAVSLIVYQFTRSILITALSSMMVLGMLVMMGFIPIWIVVVQGFITFAIVGQRVFLGDVGSGSSVKKVSVTLDFEKASEKFKEFHNNLDELLGIHTINVDYTNDVGLELYGNELRIDNKYDWFIVDKVEGEDIFKVVGVHKFQKQHKITYMLGKKGEIPFLRKVDGRLRTNSVEDILPVVVAASIVTETVKEMSKK